MRLQKLYGAACAVVVMMSGTAGAQVIAPEVPNVPIPQGVDPFNLSLDEAKKYSSAKNFELLGHSYFKIDQRTPYASGNPYSYACFRFRNGRRIGGPESWCRGPLL